MKALFLGGDLRQKYACDYLNRCNVSSEFIADFILDEKLTQRIKNFSIIGLPIPISKDEMHLNTLGNNLINIYDILSALSENTIVFGGKISDFSVSKFFEKISRITEIFFLILFDTIFSRKFRSAEYGRQSFRNQLI